MSTLGKSEEKFLTPLSRRDETTDAAVDEGLKYGIVTFGIMLGVLQVALKKSPGFVTRTNWQSRTAIVIMPTIFMASLKSEQRHLAKMREIAQEVEMESQRMKGAVSDKLTGGNVLTEKIYLEQMYQSSINQDEHVTIVPGNELNMYHHSANYVANNPAKVLASMAVPAVGYIYYLNNSKSHLGLAQKLMHTRVIGQFAVICSLLGVMGFTEYMHVHGRYVTQAESDARLDELQQIRLQLIQRLKEEHDHEEQIKRNLALAHEQDILDHTGRHHKVKKTHKTKKQQHDESD